MSYRRTNSALRYDSPCEPRWFFFLNVRPQSGCRLRPACGEEAQRYVERSVERLPPELGRRSRPAQPSLIKFRDCPAGN